MRAAQLNKKVVRPSTIPVASTAPEQALTFLQACPRHPGPPRRRPPGLRPGGPTSPRGSRARRAACTACRRTGRLGPSAGTRGSSRSRTGRRGACTGGPALGRPASRASSACRPTRHGRRRGQGTLRGRASVGAGLARRRGAAACRRPCLRRRGRPGTRRSARRGLASGTAAAAAGRRPSWTGASGPLRDALRRRPARRRTAPPCPAR
mmetsp:Transcript_11061/g.31323  ORF Transcript_11061/g.31323 Transcript_11061/m.31323 type:complete len:208 (-) Transcript_11061:228-851(-)